MVERSIRIRQVGGSMPPTSNEDTKNRGRCDGVVNVSDSKSDPFGGAGSNPANVLLSFFLPNWRNGSAPAYGAGGCGFEPHVGLFASSLFVLVAQLADRPLHTRKAQGSIPCENSSLVVFSRKVERSIRPENCCLFFPLLLFCNTHTHILFLFPIWCSR